MTHSRLDYRATVQRVFIGSAFVIALALCWAAPAPSDRHYFEGVEHRLAASLLARTRPSVHPGAVDIRARSPRLSEAAKNSYFRHGIAEEWRYWRHPELRPRFRMPTDDLARYPRPYLRQTAYNDIGAPGDRAARGPGWHVAERAGPADRVATIIETVPRKAADPRRQAEITEVMSDLGRMDFDKALEAATKMTAANPGDPAGYNLQGGAYLGKKDYARARKSFEKALSLQSDNNEALLYLAQLDVQQNAIASAQKRYQAMLAKDPKNVDAMVGMAQMEAHQRNDKAQLAWLEKARAARPEAAAPRIVLGTYYLRAGDNPKALAELTDALQFNPGNPEVLDLLGQAQVADGQKAPAVVTYQQLAAARPESPLAHYRLALAQVNAGDTAGAEASLRRALELKPDYLDAAFVLVGLDIRNGRPAEAAKLAQQLQSSMPKSPAGFVMEGDVLAAQDRYADAVKAYERGFDIQPTGLLAVKVHAAQSKAGDPAQADAKLQQWLKLHPDDVGVRQYLAGEKLRLGQNKLAIEQYQWILNKDPNNLLALNNLANLYQTEKDPRARDVAERAYKLMPNSAMVADTLGWILVEQGKTARGLKLVQDAAAKDPQNPEVRYHLAVALAKSGDKVNARKELQSLLAGDQTFPQREAAQTLLQQL